MGLRMKKCGFVAAWVIAEWFVGCGIGGGLSGALAQSVEQGEAVFRKCMACHAIGEGAVNRVGPQLNGVVGRKAGTAEGYAYSQANKTSGLVWDEDTLREYLRDPRAKVPGTKMTFAGLPKPDDIESVILYLKKFDAAGKPK